MQQHPFPYPATSVETIRRIPSGYAGSLWSSGGPSAGTQVHGLPTNHGFRDCRQRRGNNYYYKYEDQYSLFFLINYFSSTEHL